MSQIPGTFFAVDLCAEFGHCWQAPLGCVAAAGRPATLQYHCQRCGTQEVVYGIGPRAAATYGTAWCLTPDGAEETRERHQRGDSVTQTWRIEWSDEVGE